MQSALRHAQQAQWLLSAATDWSRVILKEDARASQIDSLSEPWAVPLSEVKLSSFLRSNNMPSSTNATNNSEDELLASQVFLSGAITDELSKLNFFNLLGTQRPSAIQLKYFTRLFDALHLPMGELQNLIQTFTQPNNPNAPMWPQRLDDLMAWGLTTKTLNNLRPYATWINDSTLINLNTATATVLYACVDGIDMAQAEQLSKLRDQQAWTSLSQVQNAFGNDHVLSVSASQHQLLSTYFMVTGKIRIDETAILTSSLVQRNASGVNVMWSDKGALVRSLDTTMAP
jgi:general secretion pathway protein K